MRIRKNAKVSPLLFTSHAPATEDLQAHVCQLNQSPWDVIPFGSYSYQLVFEESFYGSFGDSIGAAESVASMRNIGSQEKPAEMVEEMVEEMIEEPAEKGSNSKELKDAGEEGEEEEARRSSMLCQRNDGRGWHCKKRAKPGQSYCNHHLSLLRFHHQNSIISNNSKAKGTKGNIASKNRAPPAVPGTRRTRAKAKKKGSSSNPSDFYYYSGYGPRCWGRRRLEKEEAKALEESRAAAAAATANAANAVTITSGSASPTRQTTSQSSPSRIRNEKFDYVDDDDDDEDDEEERSRDSGRKRMRKPVKARSLKSLM